jgi:hypothetical protein
LVQYSTKEGSVAPELIVEVDSRPGQQLASGSEGVDPGDAQRAGSELIPGNAPARVTLGPTYPNPFRTSATIEYSLPEPVDVQLIVFNVHGQVVRRLVDAREVPGYKRVVWDGRDDTGHVVGSGVYFLKLGAGEMRMTKKVLFRK